MGIRSVRRKAAGGWVPAVYRYGMLVFILLLLVRQVHWQLTLPTAYSGDPYGTAVVILMLLFNHLAYAFTWRRSIAVVLWTLAWIWLGFGSVYIFFLSRVLYPSLG